MTSSRTTPDDRVDDGLRGPADVSIATPDEVAWLRRFIACSVFGPPPDEIQRALRILDTIAFQSANVPARTFTICEDHKDADWNQPAIEGVDCILCRLFYLEAQESLLEEWQQRAKKAEDTIAEIHRPLDAQMARLNETVTRLNEENERLRSQSATLPGWISAKDRLPEEDGEYLCVHDWDHDPKTADVDLFTWHKGQWYDTFQACFLHDHDREEPPSPTNCITHWMPKPALPPQPADRGNK